MSKALVQWAQKIQALSQTGLTYAEDPYDRARYEELREIAAEMLAAPLGAEPPNSPGCSVPKRATRRPRLTSEAWSSRTKRYC